MMIVRGRLLGTVLALLIAAAGAALLSGEPGAATGATAPAAAARVAAR